MKTTRFIIAALTLGMIAAAGCTNDDGPQGNDPTHGTVHITATIDGMQTRAPHLDADGAGSFGVNDVWGLYTFTGDAASPAYTNENIEHYADNRDKLLWDKLSETAPVIFAAHYPRITGEIADPTAYSFSPGGNFEHNDLLFATATQSKGGTIALNFRHLMHRLVINLKPGEGMTADELSGALIRTVGRDNAGTMRATIPINLLTGELGNTYGRIAYSNADRDNADWIVAPQLLAGGDEWLIISTYDDVWYYPVPADGLTLRSGHRLTLTLTLKKTPGGGNEVELTSSGISGWDDSGEPIEDDVVIPPAATITAAEVILALKDRSPGTIEIDGDLTLDLNESIPLNADQTLTIVPGATLTLSGGSNDRNINCVDKTLTVGGGGRLLIIRETYGSVPIIQSGTLRLVDNVTVEVKGSTIQNCAVEVGDDAALVLNSRFSNPLLMQLKPLTVNGKIQIKNFNTSAIQCGGKLLIDGGTISIEGLGAGGIGWEKAIDMSSTTSALEIARGGTLTSTVAGGVVYLTGGCSVKGAGGLFRSDTHTSGNDEETVSPDEAATMELRRGFYTWDTANSIFVWER